MAAAPLEAPSPSLLDRSTWRGIARVMRRPQPVTVPMVTLFAIIPLYLFIDSLLPGRVLHSPALALDAAIPLWPAWSVAYLSLFLAALLPVFVVHQQELVHRTILAFLMAWVVAYAFFVAYPTVTPRPREVPIEGFASWLLVTIYRSDVDSNCFPSLHVAQCFVAAFAVGRVHRGLGRVAHGWAFLVALSTLFTKQHYVLDVLAGIALAWVAHRAFLRGFRREAVPEDERRLAPALAQVAVAVYAAIVLLLGIVYAFAPEAAWA